MTIKGMTLESQLTAQASGKSEWIQTDNDGNMLAHIAIKSIYSPDSNTCTITTITKQCKGQGILSTSTPIRMTDYNNCYDTGTSYCNSRPQKYTHNTQNYYTSYGEEKVYCTEFEEAVETVQEVRF